MSKQIQVHDTGDRKFKGDVANALFKSQEEAPEVGNYNYESVQTVEGTGFIEMDSFQDQWTTSLYGQVGNGPAQVASVEALLNDAYLCIKIDDGIKLMECLNTLTSHHQIQYPADVLFGELFQDTLWNRVSDPEIFPNEQQRSDALELLSGFHKSEE